MMQNWTFSARLSLGFGLVLLLTVITGAVSYSAMQSVVEEKDQVIRITARNLIEGQKLETAMREKVSGIRGYLLSRDKRFTETIRSAEDNFTHLVASIRLRGLSDSISRSLDAVERSEAAYQQQVETLIREAARGTSATILAEGFEEKALPRFDQHRKDVTAFISLLETTMEQERADASSTASRSSSLVGGLATGAVLLGILLAVILTRSLTRQVGASVQHVRNSSAELQATASQQASGAKEQATAMNEISTTISELLTSSRQIAESAQRVAGASSDAAGAAKDGDGSVQRASEAVEEIRRQVETIVQHMLALGKKSQQIGGILEIINELAEQTNILAINATVEASGAGESGRRFAVVGEEIRKLADRVGGSTKEIRGLIEEIRASVNATVMATETGSKTVEAGSQRFQELAQSFKRIGEQVLSAADVAREIELSTKQQTTAVEQVNVAIANVTQATKEAETGAGQTLETASQLSSLSRDLQRLITSGAEA